MAALLSAVLGHWPDLGIILGLLAMNAVVGFREEYHAVNVIAALKAKLALLVWGYALAWFLINDRVKLLAYGILDRRHSGLVTKEANR